jgi:phosphoglucosamine mutase
MSHKARALSNQTVQSAIKSGADSLGENGRILVRASGTEELVRVMAEADTMERAKSVVQSIVDVLVDSYGI